MPGRKIARFVVLAGGAVLWWLIGAGVGDNPVPLLSASPSTTTLPAPTTSTTEPVCETSPPPPGPIVADDSSSLSVAVALAGFDCAHALVVVDPDNLITHPAGIQLAAAAGGPLLLTTDTATIEYEAARLGADIIYLLVEVELTTSAEQIGLTVDEAIETTLSLREGAILVENPGNDAWSRTLLAALSGAEVVDGGTTTPDLAFDADQLAMAAPPAEALWLADGSDPGMAAPVVAAAGARGESALLVDPTDLRRLARVVEGFRRIDPQVAIAAGPFEKEALSWQLAALASAPELPGGGLTLFPGRRLVALYGSPTTPNLGVLGSQSPQETLDRLTPLVEEYSADGMMTIPTYEIIATVASASAGSDNDYSEETELELLRPWIELAAEAGAYVVLDLQPGRTDFLTQAKLYEDFLRLPHVGLALDPEWRLQPDQVHLRQVGTVDAAEINTVVEWLAKIVREENLPQKLLLLHQFKLSMITNRDQVATPPELAVVVQMDGQGPLGSKYGTYRSITEGTQGVGWLWGWKNFYSLDTPLATAEEVLALEPLPVLVSYQ